MVLSDRKVIATIVCNSHDLTTSYHKKVLFIGWISQWIANKATLFGEEKILFLHDNAPVHTFENIMSKIVELCYKFLPDQPYSPDFAHCNFYLFENLKNSFGGKRFVSKENVITETNVYFAEFKKFYYWKGLRNWTNYIKLKMTVLKNK